MNETLIPPWYQSDQPSCNDITIVSTIWGMSLGLSGLGIFRAIDQSYHQYRRKQKITSYMVFIWLELIASTVLGGIVWGHVQGHIPSSLGFFFGVVVLWIFQVHCIMQIIINRIALLATSPATVRRLRWSVFTILVLINISVGIIWIPSRLQISSRWVDINNVFDRIEKVIFLLVDASLNCYFVHLVRTSLIKYGLTRYKLLYRFNIVMIVLSVSMDVLIIGMMSLNNSFIYAIFHPLAYLVKLHIELCMADLIARIVKAAGSQLPCSCTSCHTHNEYPLGQDLNDITTRFSAPAVLAQVAHPRSQRYTRRPSWRRSLHLFNLNEHQWEGSSNRGQACEEMPSPLDGGPDERSRSRSWAGPIVFRKDSGFWPSSRATSTNQSTNNNYDGHDE